MGEQHRYVVRVEATVVIEARNAMSARAKGETEVKRAIEAAYINGGDFGDGLEEFTYRARKAERVDDD